MADFVSCVNEAVKAKSITKKLADQILSSSDPEAELDSIVLQLSRDKKEAALSAIRIQEALNDMENVAPTQHGVLSKLAAAVRNTELNEFDAAEALIATMTKSERASYKNVEFLARSIAGRHHAKNAEMLSRFRTRKLGLSQDREGLINLVRSLSGESIKDAEVAKYAKGLSETFEELRQQFNKAGGSIYKNEDWVMPQTHQSRAMTKAKIGDKQYIKDRGAWKETILPLLNRDKMTDDIGRRLSDEQLSESLDYTFDTIVSGGLNKTKDTVAPRLGKKLSRKHSDQRFLFFKDADSWIEYHDRYGRKDILTTLMDHIDNMSHDIALMQRFGPNPKNTYEALRATAKKNGASALKLRHADAVFNVATGRVNGGELQGLADVSQAASNVITSAYLGSAFISALSDVAFNGITSSYRGFNGLKSLHQAMIQLNPANEADRIFAVRSGLIAESWSNMAHGGNRYVDDYGAGATAKVSEVVMRGSLLSPWTEANRHGFGLAFNGVLADNFGKAYSKLDEDLQKAFKDYDITPDDWDTFRKSTPLKNRGADFADLTAEGGEKFQQMVLSETDFAVPVPDYRVRAITTGGLERASVKGQVWRVPMMLKSFPLTVLTTHFSRMANQASARGKLQYFAALMTSTMIMGGIALQFKDIAKGKEPRNIDQNGNFMPDKDFVLAAVVQGGGLGLYGDFAFSSHDRFGQTFMESLLGPKSGLIDDAIGFTQGNVFEAFRGEETNILGESAQLFGQYQPKIWQTRLLQDAMVDQLEILADNDAEARFNRAIRRSQEETGQDYWWKPGEMLPDAID